MPQVFKFLLLYDETSRVLGGVPFQAMSVDPVRKRPSMIKIGSMRSASRPLRGPGLLDPLAERHPF